MQRSFKIPNDYYMEFRAFYPNYRDKYGEMVLGWVKTWVNTQKRPHSRWRDL
jgi:hypothetical protein